MKRLNGQREVFERRADELRERLFHTIEALDQRRHALLDVKTQVRRHGAGVVTGGLMLAIMGGAVVIALVQEARARGERLRRERVRALVRFWKHPDWVAPRGKPSVPREIGRKVLVGAVSFAAMQLIRRGIRLTLAAPRREALSRRSALELPGPQRRSPAEGPV
ncbi:hypothetical protein SOCEGT47_073720 [Sorangium cellulosum]|uniref:DUF3618 domain-containing protein n=1 Tax=Sorangium cellulosum TaxID=56 RepID=A0A4V0NEN6_SORCE|nr:hypothetical protein [Sorangium cellulosum]AUX26802.1 hypothetical protein SOCEGT47_073720 [Sorangium cellulosum]